MKSCPSCGVEKPATPEYFSRDKNRACGLYPVCKDCHNAKQRADRMRRGDEIRRRDKLAYAANPEPKKERSREYQKEHREESREAHQAWRDQNRDLARSARRAWERANPEKVRDSHRRTRRKGLAKYAAKQRAWCSKNPEKARAIGAAWSRANSLLNVLRTQRRRSRVLGLPGTLTSADVARMYLAQGGRCFYCGSPAKLTVDHKIPVSRPELLPTNGPENVVLACGPCNASKKDLTTDEFLARRATRGY